LYQKQTTGTADELRRALGILCQEGDTVELRCLAGRKTFAGWFDDFEVLADEAAKADARAWDVYVTLNPCDTALLARADNEVVEADGKKVPTTSDRDIKRRRWVLVDCDPVRPARVSSTSEEKGRAIERAKAVYRYLRRHGIKMDWADSGNGIHLLIPVDLPNDQESRALIEKFLRSLSFKFSDDTVEIDTSTYNAARITKCYGVVARKGKSIERSQAVSASKG
jgi:hypothetical protein